MFALKICHGLWRFHFRKLFFIFTTMLLVYTLSKLYSPRKEQVNERFSLDATSNAIIIPIDADETTELVVDSLESLLSTKECPLCLGVYDCKESLQSLSFDNTPPVSVKQHKISYKSSWKSTESALIKIVPLADVKFLQRQLCQFAKLPSRCKVEALVHSKDLHPSVQQSNIKDVLVHISQNRSNIPISLCITNKLAKLLSDLSDDDGDGNVTVSEHLMLLTTLSLNVEALALKFFKHIKMNVPVLQHYGLCGRALVLEGGLTPLKEFLREPFEFRAGLAAKIFQIVDDFLEDDPDWAVMFSGFSYDNLVVDKNGDVVILDMEDFMVIDKNEYWTKDESEDGMKDPCNQECFIKFTHQLLHSPNVPQTCQLIPQHTHLMYAIICQQILSNLDEHRVEDYFNIGSNSAQSKKLENPGLLHGLPDKDRDAIEELLRECVLETEDGGRIQAAEELRDLLMEYTNEELTNNDNEKEDSEENDLDTI